MIGKIMLVTLPGFALGALVMALANRHVTSEVARARWLKLLMFGLIVHTMLGAAAVGRLALMGVVAVILAVGTAELAGAWARLSIPRPSRVWLVYAGAAVSCLWVTGALAPERFAALYVTTAAFDGFSQVIGQWLGRTRLAPKVSPGKTIEGALGGLCAAVVVALSTRDLLVLDTGSAALVGIATGVAGLVGDLSASWVKRRAGLKDYSDRLPGQGGVLDRFDSLLGALVLVGLPWVLAEAFA